MKERIIEFLTYLDIGQKKFEVNCGLSNGYVNNIGDSIRENTLAKIFLVYPELSRSWLLTGEGDMLKSGKGETPAIIDDEDDYIIAQRQGIKLLPEIDFKFSAGSAQLISSNDIIRHWYLPDCTDCDAVVQVVGNSMLPNLPSGCYAALKRLGISNGRFNEMPYGNVFGVVVEDRDTGEYYGHIKVLRRHEDRELAKEYVIAHSYNDEEYDDFDIPVCQIRSLWIVKQHIVSDMQ